MADSVQKIRVEGGKEAEAAIQGVQSALENFNKTAAKNRDAVRLLDKATGGAITKFQDFQKGITQGISTVKGLSKTFKGLRVAIAATGIGLIVVALGTIATYWDEITGFISGATAELERQQEELERTKKLLNDEVNLLNSQIRLQELKGESTDETLLTLRKTLLIQQELVQSQIEEQQLLLDKEIAQKNELTFFDKLKASFDIRKGYNYEENLALITAEKKASSTEEQIELEDKINKLKDERIKIETSLTALDVNAEKRRKKELDDEKKITDELLKQKEQAAKDDIKLQEEIDKALLTSKQDLRAKELADLDSYYEQLIIKATLAGNVEQETLLALEEQKRIALAEQKAEFKEEDDAEAQKIRDDEDKIREEKIKNAQEILDAELELQQKERDFAKESLDDTARIFGEETKLGKAALIAKQLIAAKAFLIDIGALKNKASITIAEANLDQAKGGEAVASGLGETLKLGFPKAILPLIAYGATAAGIIGGIVSAVKSTKKVAASVGGSGSGASPTVEKPTFSPPAFNIVGQNDTSQLAEAITGQTQAPIKAYVVSNEVTTAQSLDRNIVQGATIG